MRDLNQLYRSQPALHEVDFSWDGFEWIDFHDVDNSIVSFRAPGQGSRAISSWWWPTSRRCRAKAIASACPRAGFYRELLNSDSAYYGGGNVGNAGGVPSEPAPWQGQPHSIVATLPPLGVVFFKPGEPSRQT